MCVAIVQSVHLYKETEPEFLNYYRAQASIQINHVAWRAGTTILLLLGSLPPIDCLKIPALLTGNSYIL
jgi:hypothetical protein